MKSEIVVITAIICLTILGVAIIATEGCGSGILTAIVSAISVAAGIGGTIAAQKIARKVRGGRP